MYPDQSLLDVFLRKKRIPRDPKKICMIKNGKVVYNNPYKEEK